MWAAVISLGVSGLVIGMLLAVAANKLKVETDPKIGEILSVLPGANCGACGYPGCSGLAAAIVLGKAPVNGCKVGGNTVAEKVSGIMGVSAGAAEPVVAVVYCQGDSQKAEQSAEYAGVADCQALSQLGGTKTCAYGCVGLGSCVKACPFGAMYVGEGGLPVVIREKCTGCGICVKTCPRKVIGLAPADKEVHILCRSYDKGPAVRKYCKVGCIACQLCVRTCPEKAISMDGGTLAKIDYSLCTNCGACVAKCPVKTIQSYGKKVENVAS